MTALACAGSEDANTATDTAGTSAAADESTRQVAGGGIDAEG